MNTFPQHLFALYWAKCPELPGFPHVDVILRQLALSESDATVLRGQYEAVLGGGAKAVKVLAGATPMLTDVIEQFDEAPIKTLQTALENAIASQAVPVQAPFRLLVAAPSHLNGLLVWLVSFPGMTASVQDTQANYAAICKVGGSPARVAQLVDLAQQFGLLTEADGNYRLTALGQQYAEGGPGQGSARWQMTETRCRILSSFWEEHVGQQPAMCVLEAFLLAYPETPTNDALSNAHAQKWLEELQIMSESGWISSQGLRILRSLQAGAKGGDVAPLLAGLAARFSEESGELRLDIARLRDEVRGIASSTVISPRSASAEPVAKNDSHIVPGNAPEITFDDVLQIDFKPVPNESEYLAECAQRLRTTGYHISNQDLANLYICARTSRLTILAGPPGVGKSSFIRRFSGALGHQTTLKEVSVRRGWTDDQQFLGSVNRLHQRYDPAPTGVVHHLMKADVDQDFGLYWFLLDEFNLSVPEFYFAEFISVLEADEPAVRLYSQGMNLLNASDYRHEVRIGRNVHFFGTINLDESGFTLSPRLLDRANFVWVERRVGLEVLDAVAELPPATIGPITAAEFTSRYLRPALSPSVKTMFKKVLDVLGQEKKDYGTPHIVSPRAILGVAAYVANSAGLLSESDALDYAVLQRILPGIRGVGPEFGKRMAALVTTFQDLELSRSLALLKRMNEAGARHGEFDFVASLW